MIFMGTVSIKKENSKDTFTIHPSQYEVTELGIEQVIRTNDDGTYFSKVLLPKEIIVEAFDKYIIEPRTGKKRNVK